MHIKPTKKTKCFAVLEISNEAYLTNRDPSEGLDSSDTDHLFREIVEGVFYPVESSEIVDGKKVIGYFVDETDKEYIAFYNDFYTDMEWKSVENLKKWRNEIMNKNEDRALVQGTVTFTVNCNDLKGLVPLEVAMDESRLKDWLEDKAFKMIENAQANVDIEYSRIVTLNSETSDELINKIIDDASWKKCIEEDKAARKEEN